MQNNAVPRVEMMMTNSNDAFNRKRQADDDAVDKKSAIAAGSTTGACISCVSCSGGGDGENPRNAAQHPNIQGIVM